MARARRANNFARFNVRSHEGVIHREKIKQPDCEILSTLGISATSVSRHRVLHTYISIGKTAKHSLLVCRL